MNIKQVPFASSNFYEEEHIKNQIYLHHTAGNASAEGVFQGWAANSEKIATCVVISGKGPGLIDGQIIQGFSSKYWAYHLGIKEKIFNQAGLPYRQLDKFSIGIEICNWGALTPVNGQYFNYVNKIVPKEDVIKLDVPFKGNTYFHKYTDAQIASVRDLLLLWRDKYNIPLTYNMDIWKVSPRALKGEAGVYTHNSVRVDKIDVYPCPRLIEMLQSID